MTSAGAVTMTFTASDMQAELFHSMGYAAQLAKAIERGRNHGRMCWNEYRIDSTLESLILRARNATSFDPAATEAREVVEWFESLVRSLRGMLFKAERAQLRNHAFHKSRYDSIEVKVQIIENITESWELALNPKFGSLVDDAIKSLNLSGKSNSDWRISLAKLQD